MIECDSNYSFKGRCCCNCKYRKPVAKHPWNEGAFKGRVTETFGYVCISPELESAIFYDRPHGMCEMHEAKE